MQNRAMLQSRAQSPMQAGLQVQLAARAEHLREQVAVEACPT